MQRVRLATATVVDVLSDRVPDFGRHLDIFGTLVLQLGNLSGVKLLHCKVWLERRGSTRQKREYLVSRSEEVECEYLGRAGQAVKLI